MRGFIGLAVFGTAIVVTIPTSGSTKTTSYQTPRAELSELANAVPERMEAFPAASAVRKPESHADRMEFDGAAMRPHPDEPTVVAAVGATAQPEETQGIIDDPPLPLARPRMTPEEICDAIVETAKAQELPISFFSNLIWQESRFVLDAVSPAGARGVAQFMSATAKAFGLGDPFDPVEALPASARFLKRLAKRFGNLGLAAAAYNAGPTRVQKWLAKSDKLPKETRDYVRTITGRSAEQWRAPESPAKAFVLAARMPCKRDSDFITELKLAGEHAPPKAADDSKKNEKKRPAVKKPATKAAAAPQKARKQAAGATGSKS